MFRRVLNKIHPAVFLRAAKVASTTISEHEQRLIDICRLSPEEALRKLGVTEAGLTEEGVEAARREFGNNDFGAKKEIGIFMELVQRCKNPLVIQLLIICIVSAATGDIPTAVVVGGMIFLSVVLGYVQEHRSSKAVEQLQAMVETNCLVIRGGKEIEIPMAEIVPGDIIVLQAGAIIPADLRLITAKDFFVSQSSLTGESMPVEKITGPSDISGRGVIELQNACFQGSNVLSGAARGVVVNTGLRTHFGSISAKLSGERVQTSFDRGIAAFTWLMIRFMVVMTSVVFLIVGLT
jgi:Mg2+-importing ATPase